jgi:hypothetical protein
LETIYTEKESTDTQLSQTDRPKRASRRKVNYKEEKDHKLLEGAGNGKKLHQNFDEQEAHQGNCTM